MQVRVCGVDLWSVQWGFEDGIIDFGLR
jgi:hypothetical protein